MRGPCHGPNHNQPPTWNCLLHERGALHRLGNDRSLDGSIGDIIVNPTIIIGTLLTIVGFKYYPALLAIALASGFVIATAKAEAV